MRSYNINKSQVSLTPISETQPDLDPNIKPIEQVLNIGQNEATPFEKVAVNKILDDMNKLKKSIPPPHPAIQSMADMKQPQPPPSTIDKSKEIAITNRKLYKYFQHPRLSKLLYQEGIPHIDKDRIASMNIRRKIVLLEEIREVLATSFADKIVDSIATQGIGLYENLVSEFYDCKGLAKNLLNIPEFQQMLDELTIEYEFPRLNIHYRILISIAQATITQNKINQILKHSMNPTSEEFNRIKKLYEESVPKEQEIETEVDNCDQKTEM